MTIIEDFKPYDCLAHRRNANVQAISDDRAALDGTVHEAHGERFRRVLKASAVNAKALFAEAPASVKIRHVPLDDAEVPVQLSV
jgi:hypothetical protein